MTVVLPDAVTNNGKQYQVKHTSDHSGTPVVQALAQKLRGRQQLIAGSITQTIALGATLSVRSDGTNWLVI